MSRKSSEVQITPKHLQVFFGFVVALTVIFFAVIAIASDGGNDAGSSSSTQGTSTANGVNDGFLGDKGIVVKAAGNSVAIEESSVDDGDMHSFTYYSEKEGKNIYFFVIKASDGTYRVAANACEVCYGEKKGFTQVGDKIKCENCGTTYGIDQIAKEKGGCNPRPIDADASVEGGQVLIDIADLESTADMF